MAAGGVEHEGHSGQLRLLVDSVLDYAIFVLDPGGHVATWNLGAQRIKGYEAEEIVGQHFRRFYTDEDRAREHPEFELATAARDGRFEEEGWRVRKDGSRFWANVVITALHDPDGTLVGYGKVTRDLTARRDAEASLLSAQAKLRESNDELRRFAAVAAHDLNGPLISVHSLVEILRLREGERLSSGVHELLDQISGAVNRMQELIEDLLTYASFEHAEPVCSSFNVVATVRSVLSDLGGVIAERGADITVEIPLDAEVLAEPTGLAVLLQNLVSNAVKFADDQSPRVAIDAQPTGGGWRVTVADNGEGIDAHDQERIFDAFQRLPSAQRLPGTGLGLAICRRVVERAGGNLGVDSAPGRGSRFWFALKSAGPRQRLGAAAHELEQSGGVGPFRAECVHAGALGLAGQQSRRHARDQDHPHAGRQLPNALHELGRCESLGQHQVEQDDVGLGDAGQGLDELGGVARRRHELQVGRRRDPARHEVREAEGVVAEHNSRSHRRNASVLACRSSASRRWPSASPARTCTSAPTR